MNMEIEEIRILTDYGIGGFLAFMLIKYIGDKLDKIHECLQELKGALRHG
jgi:hypothetical protein